MFPTKCADIYVIYVDAIGMTATLPKEKIDKAKHSIESMLQCAQIAKVTWITQFLL